MQSKYFLSAYCVLNSMLEWHFTITWDSNNIYKNVSILFKKQQNDNSSFHQNNFLPKG